MKLAQSFCSEYKEFLDKYVSHTALLSIRIFVALVFYRSYAASRRKNAELHYLATHEALFFSKANGRNQVNAYSANLAASISITQAACGLQGIKLTNKFLRT